MNSNSENITFLVDYIENHLTEDISLNELADAAGYSKYHLHRMFTCLIGFSVHAYIRRKKITEAAKKLAGTDEKILDIALCAGYDSQQSFSLAFKELYHHTPQAFRKKGAFYPVQLKFQMTGDLSALKGDRILDIKHIERGPVSLAGYTGNTRRGFFVIPRLWNKVHKMKNRIPNRTDTDFLIGLNDYSASISYETDLPVFDYIAAVEIDFQSEMPVGVQVFTFPPSKYVVFSFRGNPRDSLQPVADYIYKVWLPESCCQLNQDAKYDFARYGEITDAYGRSDIEFWLPVK